MPAPRSHLPPLERRSRPGASRRRRRTPLAWLPWTALGLSAVLLLLSALVVDAVDDGSGSEPGAASAAPTGAQQGGEPTGATGGAAGPAPRAAPAPLRVEDLLALSAGDLAARAGQSVTGSARVQSVVSDEGFWVGTRRSRVFGFLAPEARGGSGESGLRVRRGRTVQLTGDLVRLAEHPEAADGVTGAEGRGDLERSQALVLGRSVELAGAAPRS